MNELVFKSQTEAGEKYGGGRVLDYIGVGRENLPDTDCVGKYSMFEESEE